MSAEGFSEGKRESDVPITYRQIVRHELPFRWVDSLLDASCSIAPDATPEQAALAMVVAVAGVLPGVVVAVRMGNGSERQTTLRSPPLDADESEVDGGRVFPELAHEHLVVVAGELGATIHFGAEDGALFADAGFAQDFIEPLERSIGAALLRARAHQRACAQRDELEAQLVQTSKLASLGQIAAGIVHELNNPLTSIVAYSDYLHAKAKRAGVDPADVERLARIKEAAARILAFSRDLVTYSKPSSGHVVPVAIHEVIERSLVFCDHVLEEMRVEVERDFGDVGAVLGVSTELAQVFVNLFTNAAHAMREHGGRLSIKTEVLPSGVMARVTIRDEGHGIADAVLARIFDPYFTTKPDGLGSGLGLSIVRNIIVSHGGAIRAFAHPSRGAVFEVDLPLASAAV